MNNENQTNVQSFFGVPWWRLANETDAFYWYGGRDGLRGPWMPTEDLQDIIAEHFPDMTLFSKKEMVKRTGYTDWRSMERAITACGSAVHFVEDGPIWATVPNSFDAGMARVTEQRAKSEAANLFHVR